MGELPHLLKRVTVWALVLLALFLGFRLAEQRQQRLQISVVPGSAGSVTEVVLRRGPDGHYHWPARIGDIAVDLLVDTGASRTVVTQRVRDRAGIDAWPEIGRFRGHTANGPVEGPLVRADVALQGGLTLRNLPVAVLPQLGSDGLLGMDVLGRLQLQQAAGELRLQLPVQAD